MMKIELKKIEKPASIIGAFVLILLGIWIATSKQMSFVNEKDPSNKKEISAPVRIAIGIIVLLTGIIIFSPFLKSKQE